MTEIAEFPWNGLSVVSTFSGCGGSCLGFKMAGYRVLWASEFVPAARETYRANHPMTHLDESDIRRVTAATIRAVIGDVEIDVLEGSPPCASFSTAGKQQRGWGQVRKYSDVEQRTDDLFDQYIRLVDELRPRAFVAENVAGMVKGVAKGFFKRYLTKMRELPYNVEAMVLDAQWLGVPQRRRRLIFVGVRKDVGAPRWPAPLLYRYSIRDAIPWITQGSQVGGRSGGEPVLRSAEDEPMDTITAQGVQGRANRGANNPSLIYEVRVEGATGFDGHARRDSDEPSETILQGRSVNVEVVGVGTSNSVDSLDEPAPTVVSHGRLHTESELSLVLREIEPESALAKAVGGEWDKLQPGEQSDKYMNLILPSEGEPCPTVTALGGTSAASVAHPYERRKFSIAELRRICGFPDDFILTGTYAQQWERLGRAVPPPMMAAIAKALVQVLKGDGHER